MTATSTGEGYGWRKPLLRGGVIALAFSFLLAPGADMEHLELVMRAGPPVQVQYVVQTTATSS
jgi:hypothetical protein